MAKEANSTQQASQSRFLYKRLAAGALVIVCLLWGYNWVIMKIGLRYAGPFDYLAIRVGGGAICLFLLLLVTRRPLKPEALGYSTALGFLQVTGNLGLITWALAHGAVGRTSVLGYTMPFWVLILAWPILGERIRGAEWVAIVLAFAGLVFIFNPSGAHGTMAATVMATGGGVFWAGATVVTRILHRRRKVDLLSLAAWQMLLGAIPLIVVALLVPSRPMEWNLALVGTLAFSIVFATVVAWFLWLFVLRYLPAGLASVGSLAAPVVGIATAWLQLGEVPSLFEAVGMTLIVVALAVLTGVTIYRHDRAYVSEEPG